MSICDHTPGKDDGNPSISRLLVSPIFLSLDVTIIDLPEISMDQFMALVVLKTIAVATIAFAIETKSMSNTNTIAASINIDPSTIDLADPETELRAKLTFET